jgi:DNA-binding transcriptional ArsR family regulator
MPDSQGGWSLVQSIAAELDVALGSASGAGYGAQIIKGVFDGAQDDWKAEWPELLGRPRPWPGVLSLLAWFSDVQFESDYSRATLPMRQLTLPEALERAATVAKGFGIMPRTDLAPAEQLIDLMARGSHALESSIGLQRSEPGDSDRMVAYEVGWAIRVMRDGDLAARFWHWLDRGYYEWYRPWRESQAAPMAAEEERAIGALGAREGHGVPPMAWLSPRHPLHDYPELQRAVQEQRLRVCFWNQPFGLADAWSLGQGVLLVSFVEPGTVYTDLRERATDLARRANAFSDPTRLMILRLIRQFAKDNTQMAEFLGVARPAVSTHAKILREAGLITTTQEGRGARHTIDYAAVRRLFADLARFLDLPDEE